MPRRYDAAHCRRIARLYCAYRVAPVVLPEPARGRRADDGCPRRGCRLLCRNPAAEDRRGRLLCRTAHPAPHAPSVLAGSHTHADYRHAPPESHRVERGVGRGDLWPPSHTCAPALCRGGCGSARRPLTPGLAGASWPGGAPRRDGRRKGGHDRSALVADAGGCGGAVGRTRTGATRCTRHGHGTPPFPADDGGDRGEWGCAPPTIRRHADGAGAVRGVAGHDPRHSRGRRAAGSRHCGAAGAGTGRRDGRDRGGRAGHADAAHARSPREPAAHY